MIDSEFRRHRAHSVKQIKILAGDETSFLTGLSTDQLLLREIGLFDCRINRASGGMD